MTIVFDVVSTETRHVKVYISLISLHCSIIFKYDLAQDIISMFIQLQVKQVFYRHVIPTY